MSIRKTIEISTIKLESWISKNGPAGYDPYDIKSVPSIRKLTEFGNRNFVGEVFREIVLEFFLFFPKRWYQWKQQTLLARGRRMLHLWRDELEQMLEQSQIEGDTMIDVKDGKLLPAEGKEKHRIRRDA